jgi:hypothetical protein
MKSPIIATILLVLAAFISPAKAKSPSCVPECPFFHAWALTKVCPNLSLNKHGHIMVKAFGHGSESREILRGEISGAKLRFVRAADGAGYVPVPDPDACNQCQPYDDKEAEAGGPSPCQFLQWTKSRRVYH